MKLYEVPKKTLIELDGERYMFYHIDGMYSNCLHIESNTTQHISASANVQIVEFNKEIKNVI